MSHTLSSDDRQFLADFEACRVEPAAFDHRAHVRLAYCYLVEHDAEMALTLMRRALQAFIEHNQIPVAKYHETLTQAWILAVRHFMATAPVARDAGTFIASNPRLLDSKIMLTHYSTEVLFSPEARARFVEPDLDVIPRHDAKTLPERRESVPPFAQPGGREKRMDNVKFLKGLYEAFGRGDIPAVLGAMSPGIRWHQAEGNPYRPSGEAWVGPDAVLQNLFMRLGGEWDGFTVHTKSFHDAGDSVIVEARYTGTYKPTGKSMDTQVCHVWDVKDGKVTRFQQYVDTAKLRDVMVAG